MTTIAMTSPSESSTLSPVSISPEVKPELEDVILELAFEAMLIRVLPFSVHYLESYIL